MLHTIAAQNAGAGTPGAAGQAVQTVGVDIEPAGTTFSEQEANFQTVDNLVVANGGTLTERMDWTHTVPISLLPQLLGHFGIARIEVARDAAARNRVRQFYTDNEVYTAPLFWMDEPRWMLALVPVSFLQELAQLPGVTKISGLEMGQPSLDGSLSDDEQEYINGVLYLLLPPDLRSTLSPLPPDIIEQLVDKGVTPEQLEESGFPTPTPTAESASAPMDAILSAWVSGPATRRAAGQGAGKNHRCPNRGGPTGSGWEARRYNPVPGKPWHRPLAGSGQ